MGQERCECRRCRNRHCRQQKQTASKGHRKLFSVCQKKLRSQNGMTLTELLAAIVILGMIGTVLGGGVMMVKNVYQRTQEQADAEQALSLTAQLMTDEFANALEVFCRDFRNRRIGNTSFAEWKQPPVAALQCDRLVWHGH